MIQDWAAIEGEQLRQLVEAFRDRSLPHADWTHEAHLAVGTWHVYEFGPVRALVMLRDRIRRLNDQHGTPNSDTRGYHETITRAYVCLIADLLAREPAASDVDAVRAVMGSTIAPKTALLDYYSRDRLMSTAARRGWVSADLRPLSPPHWPRPLTTERLLLRSPELTDADAIVALITPAVSRWLATWTSPQSHEEATQRIEAALAAIESGDALHYAVARRSDGALAGWIRLERREPGSDRAELGFWFGEQFQGGGYATEAATAACTAAFRLLDLSAIEAGAQSTNAASLRVLAKLGMQPIGERLVFAPSRQRHEPCVFFEKTQEARLQTS